MSGRITLRTRLSQLYELFSAQPAQAAMEWLPRFNIAPTQDVVVVRPMAEGSGRELALLRWGLIPHWAEDLRIGNRTINARAETVAEKPSFRQAFRSRRCLVIVDGLYEWKKDGAVKQPYFICMEDDRPFALAGLWERWRGDGQTIESCTIVTTTPNAFMAQLHDRMPVILTEAAARQWLNHGLHDAGLLHSILVPYVGDDLIAHPVSTRVNSPAYDAPDCAEPISPN